MQKLHYDNKSDSYINDTFIIERDMNGKGNWILKEKATDKQIDTDKYRHDLAERNHLKLGSSVDIGLVALS